jgi:hypothetical protein
MVLASLGFQLVEVGDLLFNTLAWEQSGRFADTDLLAWAQEAITASCAADAAGKVRLLPLSMLSQLAEK